MKMRNLSFLFITLNQTNPFYSDKNERNKYKIEFSLLMKNIN